MVSTWLPTSCQASAETAICFSMRLRLVYFRLQPFHHNGWCTMDARTENQWMDDKNLQYQQALPIIEPMRQSKLSVTVAKKTLVTKARRKWWATSCWWRGSQGACYMFGGDGATPRRKTICSDLTWGTQQRPCDSGIGSFTAVDQPFNSHSSWLNHFREPKHSLNQLLNGNPDTYLVQSFLWAKTLVEPATVNGSPEKLVQFYGKWST